MRPLRFRSRPTPDSQGDIETPPLPELELRPEEWRLLVTVHSNVLLEGPEARTEAVILALTPHLYRPIHYWKGELPKSRPATLVIREVAALTVEAQQVLLHWIDSSGTRMRVIATSVQPPFPLIARGLVLADLYYRLNVVRVELERR